MCALESPNEYRYTFTGAVAGDRWASLIQPAPVVAEDAEAAAARGSPSSRAETASIMTIRRATPGNFIKYPPAEFSGTSDVRETWGVVLHRDQIGRASCRERVQDSEVAV